jgi:hypothetical protein
MRKGFRLDAFPHLVDKTNRFRQFVESFGQAFSKACAVEGA